MKSFTKIVFLFVFQLLTVMLVPNLAQAAPKTYALTVAKSGSGIGTITSSPAGINCGSICSASFKPHTKVILTAMATPGSTFQGWTGACAGTESSCTVLMKQAKTVTASFALTKVTLSLTKTGTGVVTSSPTGIDCGLTCSGEFNQYSEVTLTATPAAGATFKGWSGACTGTGYTCTMTLSQALILYANFSVPSVTSYQYDPNGNRIQSSDPLGNIRQIQYDSLNQAIRQLEPHPSAPGSTLGQIDIDYDPLGQVKRVIDPRNLATDYQIDYLGNVKTQTSPDTGLTQFTYDEAGNVKTRTDARSKTATYGHDSENRISQIAYDDQTITYIWDNCSNGIGRLCSLTNAQSNLSFNYNPHGRITGKSQTVGAVALNFSHRYNQLGQLEQITTPGGQSIDYVWLNDRIESININGQPLITQITYEPEGQVNGWAWGNSQQTERFHDLAGRPVIISMGFEAQTQLPDTRNYSYDAASRITSIINEADPSLNQSHDYDGLDRLTASQQGQPVLSNFNYAYDLSGNRTSKVMNNSATETYNIDPGSNRLQVKSGVQTINYSYDSVGNLTDDGIITYGYNAEGRRISATAPNLNAAYAYNALGQRVSKTVDGVTTLYSYDEQGHLAGEYGASGQLIQEIIWLGDLPVAVLKPTTPASSTVDIYYIYADHLGTPRKITRPGDNRVVWSWESEAFGNSLPDQNSSGLGEFVFNLRFLGQYYDQETGLHYNMARYYNPRTGRYDESDPIGLRGGINTYAYVGNNPLRWIDPRGLTKLNFDPSSGNLIVDPEVPGRSPYNMPASSGKPNCGCDASSENKGPIPSGNYTVKNNKLTDAPWYRDIARTLAGVAGISGGGDWGDWRVPLHPDPDTNTFGRKGFMMHGGFIPGSAGCIDVGGGIFGSELTEQLMNDILSDPDGVVLVIVK